MKAKWPNESRGMQRCERYRLPRVFGRNKRGCLNAWSQERIQEFFNGHNCSIFLVLQCCWWCRSEAAASVVDVSSSATTCLHVPGAFSLSVEYEFELATSTTLHFFFASMLVQWSCANYSEMLNLLLLLFTCSFFCPLLACYHLKDDSQIYHACEKYLSCVFCRLSSV